MQNIRVYSGFFKSYGIVPLFFSMVYMQQNSINRLYLLIFIITQLPTKIVEFYYVVFVTGVESLQIIISCCVCYQALDYDGECEFYSSTTIQKP